MAISDKINYLIETKTKFKDRLNSLGAEIINSTTFRNYMVWVNDFYNKVSDKTYLAETGIVGRTSQSGTPTPDSPQPINNLTGNLRFTIGKEEESENLFDDSTKNNTWIAKNGDKIFHDRQPGANCIEFNCTSGDTYTLSATFSGTDGAIVICFADANSNCLDYQLRSDSQNMTITATAPENATVMYAGHHYKEPTSITLVKGDGSSKTFTIPLGDIELCGMDAYKDKIYSSNGRFYWNKKINKIILNGSEYWNISTNFWTSSINDYAYSNNIPYSNYFKGVINKQAVTSLTEDNTLAFKSRSGEPRLYLKSSSFTTTTELKNWLSTHNLIIYYALATSITTEITSSNYPELYSVLKEVQDYLTQYKINKEFLLDYSSPEITY
jgi:hypothetical protein